MHLASYIEEQFYRASTGQEGQSHTKSIRKSFTVEVGDSVVVPVTTTPGSRTGAESAGAPSARLPKLPVSSSLGLDTILASSPSLRAAFTQSTILLVPCLIQNEPFPGSLGPCKLNHLGPGYTANTTYSPETMSTERTIPHTFRQPVLRHIPRRQQ